MRKSPSAISLLIFLAVGGLACQSSQSQRSQNPVTEAYRMMDQGQNERAAVVLEQYVIGHPDSVEAKVMLASAYMGQAGINVYAIIKQFQDILFDKPLADTFLGKGGITNPFGGDDELNGTVAMAPDAERTKVKDGLTPVENLIDGLDSILVRSKKIIEFMNRFPDVPESKWPLIDRALTLLDSSTDEKDICLYRIFIRVIYVKAYLSQEFLKNNQVGRHEWLCSVDLDGMRDSVNWVLGHLQKASSDFQIAYPDKASSLNSVKIIAAALQADLDLFSATLDAESVTTGDSLRKELHAVLRCVPAPTPSSSP